MTATFLNPRDVLTLYTLPLDHQLSIRPHSYHLTFLLSLLPFFSSLLLPIRYYTPCALSNTLSSWGQYASLKYVSFPLQTLFKSAKVIPVMLMGKFLNKTTYAVSDYGEAIAITAGVCVFGLSKEKSPSAAGDKQIQ
jgi:hypothetical protein